MHRVGKVLRLQTERAVFRIRAPDAAQSAVEEVAGVKLDAGFGRENF